DDVEVPVEAKVDRKNEQRRSIEDI
ncbi:hypothetical protein Tco_0739037, partial [Tanacetum coccineum]